MAAAAQVQGPAMARMRILIIEDERALTETLTYNLQREGYETLVAHDGLEGLRKAQTHVPDLILLDLMLPGMDGHEVCRELRAGDRTARDPHYHPHRARRGNRSDRRFFHRRRRLCHQALQRQDPAAAHQGPAAAL